MRPDFIRVRGKLDLDGAIVNVAVGVVSEERIFLGEAAYQKEFATTALIDTGASITAVAPYVVDYLGVVQSDFRQVLVPGDVGSMVSKVYPVYYLRLSMQAAPNYSRMIHACGRDASHAPGVSLLIGRDILNQGSLCLRWSKEAIHVVVLTTPPPLNLNPWHFDSFSTTASRGTSKTTENDGPLAPPGGIGVPSSHQLTCLNPICSLV